jgi:hypothetical protein
MPRTRPAPRPLRSIKRPRLLRRKLDDDRAHDCTRFPYGRYVSAKATVSHRNELIAGSSSGSGAARDAALALPRMSSARLVDLRHKPAEQCFKSFLPLLQGDAAGASRVAGLNAGGGVAANLWPPLVVSGNDLIGASPGSRRGITWTPPPGPDRLIADETDAYAVSLYRLAPLRRGFFFCNPDTQP